MGGSFNKLLVEKLSAAKQTWITTVMERKMSSAALNTSSVYKRFQRKKSLVVDLGIGLRDEKRERTQ